MNHTIIVDGGCGKSVTVYCSCQDEPIMSARGTEVLLDTIAQWADAHIRDAERARIFG